jgi:dTDP-4-dehydrorhamnose 3,5-epimerase
MKICRKVLEDVCVIEPEIHRDARGFFYEGFNERIFADLIGRRPEFVQHNVSMSHRNVLRGLHYQISQPQARLVSVVRGEVFDVVVDVRSTSPTLGQWAGITLSVENRLQLWIPEGFAHGYLVLSELAEIQYKVTQYWAPEHERCIAWNDPSLNIKWPAAGMPLLSEKDRNGLAFSNAPMYL